MGIEGPIANQLANLSLQEMEEINEFLSAEFIERDGVTYALIRKEMYEAIEDAIDSEMLRRAEERWTAEGRKTVKLEDI